MNYVNLINSVISNFFGRVRFPSFVTYFVTLRCDSHCVFCDVWRNPPPKTERELNLDEIEKIFSQLNHLDVLRISGGEPFIRTDLGDIINRIDKISGPGIIHLTTNGMQTERIIDTVFRIRNLKKIHIKVSIDNIGEKHDKARGTAGAYKKAMSTLKRLAEMRKISGFHVGINQAIISEDDIEGFLELQQLLKEIRIPVYPSIAFQAENSLYSNQIYSDVSGSFKPFGKFSEAGLKRYMKIMDEDRKQSNTSFAEKLVDNYQQMGKFNRYINNKQYPNPSCVALKDHLRILPNGDVPVCLYNGNIMGNLKSTTIHELWGSENVKKTREWVKNCPGCWQSCETAVSAVYTGDIIKGLLPNPYKKGKSR